MTIFCPILIKKKYLFYLLTIISILEVICINLYVYWIWFMNDLTCHVETQLIR